MEKKEIKQVILSNDPHIHTRSVLFDEDIINDLPLTFHPNENDATIFINSEDVIKFLNTLNVSYKIITI